MYFKVEIGLEIELKIGKNYFQIELKNSEKMMRMTWLLTWLNVSVATLNATLHFLVILVADPHVARDNIFRIISLNLFFAV